jgi:murein DD-endopeptidase MepM/ murein hydrolase activator NlpD
MKRKVSFSVFMFAFCALIISLSSCKTSDSFAKKKGKLPWPVEKGVKVSDFGSQPHPDVPSVMIENHGIDIRVDPDAPVRAVYEGEVSGILEVLGTTVVMIRHGEYVTVYQNLAAVYVKKGDRVNAKQIIGIVAKSSSNDNYILHFEVWKDSFMDPNLWLSRKLKKK